MNMVGDNSSPISNAAFTRMQNSYSVRIIIDFDQQIWSVNPNQTDAYPLLSVPVNRAAFSLDTESENEITEITFTEYSKPKTKTIYRKSDSLNNRRVTSPSIPPEIQKRMRETAEEIRARRNSGNLKPNPPSIPAETAGE